MNKYTNERIAKTVNNPNLYGGLLIAGMEDYPEINKRLRMLNNSENSFTNPRPLLKYVIRRMATFEGGNIANYGRADQLQVIETEVFCGQFSYDKELGGFVPMYVVQKRAQKLSHIILERQPSKIRSRWNTLKPFLCSPDGYEPSLIDNFEDQHLYFMKNETTGEIKIGISIHPEIRRCQIQRQVGANVVILKILPAEGRAKEIELHSMFEEYRTQGEWFEPHEDVLEYMANC